MSEFSSWQVLWGMKIWSGAGASWALPHVRPSWLGSHPLGRSPWRAAMTYSGSSGGSCRSWRTAHHGSQDTASEGALLPLRLWLGSGSSRGEASLVVGGSPQLPLLLTPWPCHCLLTRTEPAISAGWALGFSHAPRLLRWSGCPASC